MKIEDIKLGNSYKVVLPDNTILTSFKNHVLNFDGKEVKILGIYKNWSDYDTGIVIDLGLYFNSAVETHMIYFPLEWLEEINSSNSSSKEVCECPIMTLMQSGCCCGHLKKSY